MARVGMDWEVININIGKIFNFLLKPVGKSWEPVGKSWEPVGKIWEPVGKIRVITGMIRLFFWEPVGKIRVCIPFVWII